MKHRTSVWLLVLILATPGLAAAIKKGRLIGIVVDPEKKPIEGVTVTATSEQVPGGFKEIKVTDKKGVFKLDFEELNIVYQYRFDKVGYATLKAEQTWRKEGSARHTFVMTPGEAALVEDLPPASQLPPAIAAFNAGAAALKAGDADAATARFKEALGHDPELRQAWSALAVAHLERKDYQASAETAEKAIALGASDQLVLRTRWEAYRNLGDEAKTAEAQAAVEQAGILAEEAKRIFNEAVALVKADDHEGAFAKFTEASKIDPNLQEAVLGVASSGLQIKRYDEARAAAKALLENDPQNEQALRARLQRGLGTGREDIIGRGRGAGSVRSAGGAGADRAQGRSHRPRATGPQCLRSQRHGALQGALRQIARIGPELRGVPLLPWADRRQ